MQLIPSHSEINNTGVWRERLVRANASGLAVASYLLYSQSACSTSIVSTQSRVGVARSAARSVATVASSPLPAMPRALPSVVRTSSNPFLAPGPRRQR
eukprot:scaffold23058_cov68-Phaeocystis_antarctica.AAC.6